MSKRAEEAALRAYPVRTYRKDQGEPEYSSDYNANDRYRFQEGYEQAEKELALTPEDVQLLDLFALECQTEESKGRKFNSSQEFFEEVLRRFKAIKEESK